MKGQGQGQHLIQQAFDSSLEHNASRLGFLMRQETQRCILAAGYTITPEQWQALVYLDSAGDKGMSQTELGEVILRDKSTVTRLVKGMLKDDLITLTRGEEADRRTNTLRVKQRSQAMVASIWPYVITHYSEQVFAVLNEKEQIEFLRIMKKIRCRLGDM